jgi:hypothetical protein
MAESPAGLIAGYAHIMRGAARYRAALRYSPGSEPAWTCKHDHASPGGAVSCARAEKDRRTEAAKTVLALRRCEPCERWFDDGPGHDCPACGFLLERVKVQVLERSPA